MQDLKAVLSDRQLQRTLQRNFVSVWEKHISCAMAQSRKRSIAGAKVRIMNSKGKTLLRYNYGFGTMMGGSMQKQYFNGRIRKIKALLKKALKQTRKWY